MCFGLKLAPVRLTVTGSPDHTADGDAEQLALTGTGGAPPNMKLNSAKVPEIILVSGVIDMIGAEASVEVIYFDRPDGEMLGDTRSMPPPNAMANPLLSPLPERHPVSIFAEVSINIGVRSPKQGLSKRLKHSGVFLDLGTKHIGEEVAVHISQERPFSVTLMPLPCVYPIRSALRPK